ncbi:polymer-forming cytoskeletal protein [Lachnospira multipara]|uniref:polymer-forming cytoskeletal protein n=1 Tax=Lachnospira multipara TaxID=28051 RepID=UPI00047FF88C|nr:polymer-forming cytoskeletal protein [Lachnospira multipara]
MGFFKDFKDDISEDLNGLTDENYERDNEEVEEMVNTLDDPELAKMAEDLKKEAEDTITDKVNSQLEESLEEEIIDEVKETPKKETPSVDDGEEIADETAVITAGLKVSGDLESIGSIDIFGSVTGNVACRGKLTVSGVLTGNSTANEIFANSAKINGDINAKGSVKIGQGTVIVGNIVATSAVIAGAVKGDIDIQGPVIVDSTAIIVGDIKSKSVQINNGATIDGRCSQCYSDIDTNAIFG